MAYQLASAALKASTFTLIDLGAGYAGVTIEAEGECAIKLVGPGGPAPTDPGSNPLPASGSGTVNTNGWVHRAAGTSIPLGFDPPPNASDNTDRLGGGIRYIGVYGISPNGYLNVFSTRL